MRLYDDFERALAHAGDDELARLAAAARVAERVLDEYARQVEAFRIFKHRFETGLAAVPVAPPFARAEDGRAPAAGIEASFAWIEDEPGSPTYLWEALAFVLGFIVSFLVT